MGATAIFLSLVLVPLLSSVRDEEDKKEQFEVSMDGLSEAQADGCRDTADARRERNRCCHMKSGRGLDGAKCLKLNCEGGCFMVDRRQKAGSIKMCKPVCEAALHTTKEEVASMKADVANAAATTSTTITTTTEDEQANAAATPTIATEGDQVAEAAGEADVEVDEESGEDILPESDEDYEDVLPEKKIAGFDEDTKLQPQLDKDGCTPPQQRYKGCRGLPGDTACCRSPDKDGCISPQKRSPGCKGLSGDAACCADPEYSITKGTELQPQLDKENKKKHQPSKADKKQKKREKESAKEADKAEKEQKKLEKKAAKEQRKLETASAKHGGKELTGGCPDGFQGPTPAAEFVKLTEEHGGICYQKGKEWTQSKMKQKSENVCWKERNGGGGSQSGDWCEIHVITMDGKQKFEFTW